MGEDNGSDRYQIMILRADMLQQIEILKAHSSALTKILLCQATIMESQAEAVGQQAFLKRTLGGVIHDRLDGIEVAVVRKWWHW